MAGVPFEAIERLSTSAISAAARELLVRQVKLERAGAARRPGEETSDAFAKYSDHLSEVSRSESDFDESLLQHVGNARLSLFDSAQKILPPYLVFAGKGMAKWLEKHSHLGSDLASRNKKVRDYERTFLLYLQRVCTKNDSLGAFGPCGWGTVKKGSGSLSIAPEPGIGKRECFLERWTAHNIAAVMNTDPDIRLDVPPLLHPNGRLDGNQFVRTDTGETCILDADTVGLLARCKGQAPARLLGVDLKLLQELADQNIIRWEIEVPALQPNAFETLLSDLSGWRESSHRARWLDYLHPIAVLPQKFARTSDTFERMRIIEEADSQFGRLGIAHKVSDRALYAAGNPISEACFRECHFSIDERLINEVALDAAPWIDFWRDCYAFIASRVASGLRGLLESAPRQNHALPLPAFLRHCASRNVPLTGSGLVGMAHIAFQEVKAAFRETMADRAAAAECEFTARDSQLVRQKFEFEAFDEYTYPSADLQISAQSIDAVARGDYQWILAELHPPVALLHHGLYWSCPDKLALSNALSETVFGKPSFHFGFFAGDITATTTVRIFEALPALNYFVAPQRSNPQWQVIPPSETEVYVDERNGDVGLRKRGSHEYLGSFARNWIIPLGFHPFQFGTAPQMARLRCGKVIVQRRSWVVTQDELPVGDFIGASRDLIFAIERLRAERDLPRYVYIRPTEQALRRSGAEGRDKDTKPVFIDFESYLFLEIFHRWLLKAGELELSEMLPDPDHLLWQEPDGRRTFEIRTQIIPRE